MCVIHGGRSSAERGRRVAERWGCFTCHGPGGIRGAANHGRADRTVPGFEGDVMMYAKSDDDLREWIRDGVPKSRAASHTWQDQRARGAIVVVISHDLDALGPLCDQVAVLLHGRLRAHAEFTPGTCDGAALLRLYQQASAASAEAGGGKLRRAEPRP